MATEPVLIAGAGIGGLTAALTLHARGVHVRLLEKSTRLALLGVGINLLPHAVRELTDLGLRDALEDAAIAPRAIDFYDHAGTLLFREPRGLAAGDAHPQLSVHRGRLQMLLLNAVTERLGNDAVTTGAAVRGFTVRGDHVEVSSAAGVIAGSALIGADGITSVIRGQLHPGPDPLMWSGITMYRGAAPRESFLDGHTMAIINGPNGIDLVTYPIGDDLVNWVLQVPTGPAGVLTDTANWNTAVGADEVHRHVRDWNLGWLDAAALITSTQHIFSYPMVDRDPLPHWGIGPVTVLGDAAHPMYPVGANGGSQAIVDARVLADEYSAHGVVGLRIYENRRRPDTADVIAANRVMHNAAGHNAAELDRITTTYRTNTERSTRS